MGYVYKYTHKFTNKWYVGSHNGKKKSYTGSGLLWERAKLKYGIDSFKKEILYEGDEFREMEELVLILLDAANDEMSYNMKNEALGGTFFGEKNGMYGKSPSEETKYLNGKAFRGKQRPDHSIKMKGKNNPMYGKNDHAHGIANYSKNRKGMSNAELYGEIKSKEISNKISTANLGKKKPGTAKAMTGGGNSSAKPVTLNGKNYSCIKEAMDKTGLSRYKIIKLGEFNNEQA